MNDDTPQLRPDSAQTLRCSYCADAISGEVVVRGVRVYCSQACAFESARAICGADCHCNVPEKPPIRA